MLRIKRALVVAWLVAVPWCAPACADAALAESKKCMACHSVDKKRVGPAFKDVAIRYANKADAVATLKAKIRQGGSGAWGPVPMPPNAQVTEAEATQLAQWVLSLK